MFLLRWLRRTTDGALSREGEYAAHSTARRAAAAVVPGLGGRGAREEDAVDHLIEVEHEARGHGVEHQVVVRLGAEDEAAARRRDAHRDHHLGDDHEGVEDEPREPRDAGQRQVDLGVFDELVGRIHPPVNLQLLVRLRCLEHREPEVHVVGRLQVAEAEREEGDHGKHLENRRVVVACAVAAVVGLADRIDEIVREGELRVVRGQQRNHQPRLHRKPQRVPV